MQIKPKFLIHSQAPPHQVNSHGQIHTRRLYFGKKTIKPISPEADIRKNALEYKPLPARKPKATIQNDKHVMSAASSRLNAHEKLVLLSSRLDEKVRRRRQLFAFVAKVVLWGIIFYVLVLSALPAVDMIVSRWQY